MNGVSVIIPALNEEKAIGMVIDQIKESLKKTSRELEIIVVDDGSTDKTSEIAKSKHAHVIRHPIPGGYGLSLRDGIFKAKHNSLVIIDADGSYPAEKIPSFVDALEEFDMVIGARTGSIYKQSLIKYPLRKIFQLLCEFVTGVNIPDVNSGLRAFRKDVVMKFKENYCLGFSFTTTITLAFHLNGHFVKYVPIEYYQRVGKSHVRLFKDTLRATQIITQAILFYNPIKLFLLLTMSFLMIAVIAFGFYFVNPTEFALMLGQSFMIVGFLFFGIGLLADTIRQTRK